MKDRGATPNLHPAVSLHIETLVLEGFAPGERHRIGAAVQRELERMISARGTAPLAARQGDSARLDGGEFQVAPSSKADAIGAQIAAAVFRGFTR